MPQGLTQFFDGNVVILAIFGRVAFLKELLTLSKFKKIVNPDRRAANDEND
jgi:hypothetical protein